MASSAPQITSVADIAAAAAVDDNAAAAAAKAELQELDKHLSEELNKLNADELRKVLATTSATELRDFIRFRAFKATTDSPPATTPSSSSSSVVSRRTTTPAAAAPAVSQPSHKALPRLPDEVTADTGPAAYTTQQLSRLVIHLYDELSLRTANLEDQATQLDSKVAELAKWRITQADELAAVAAEVESSNKYSRKNSNVAKAALTAAQSNADKIRQLDGGADICFQGKVNPRKAKSKQRSSKRKTLEVKEEPTASPVKKRHTLKKGWQT